MADPAETLRKLEAMIADRGATAGERATAERIRKKLLKKHPGLKAAPAKQTPRPQPTPQQAQSIRHTVVNALCPKCKGTGKSLSSEGATVVDRALKTVNFNNPWSLLGAVVAGVAAAVTADFCDCPTGQMLRARTGGQR